MKALALLFAASVLALYVLVAVLILTAAAKPGVRRIDCSLASFHPDFTPAMRKACQDRHKEKP